MKKVVEIDCCKECPYFSYGTNICCHSNKDRDIKNINVFPDWCSLDTPEEYAEKNFNIDK